MKYVLIKYKNLKLLIDEGLHVQPIISHLQEIEALAVKVNDFYKNLLTATKEDGIKLEEEKKILASKIGYKIIGVPFSNNDAELYALDKQFDYDVLELSGETPDTN